MVHPASQKGKTEDGNDHSPVCCTLKQKKNVEETDSKCSTDFSETSFVKFGAPASRKKSPRTKKRPISIGDNRSFTVETAFSHTNVGQKWTEALSDFRSMFYSTLSFCGNGNKKKYHLATPGAWAFEKQATVGVS